MLSSSTSLPTSLTNSGIPAAARLWLAVAVVRTRSLALAALRRVSTCARSRDRMSFATGSVKLASELLLSLLDESPSDEEDDDEDDDEEDEDTISQ